MSSSGSLREDANNRYISTLRTRRRKNTELAAPPGKRSAGAEIFEFLSTQWRYFK